MLRKKKNNDAEAINNDCNVNIIAENTGDKNTEHSKFGEQFDKHAKIVSGLMSIMTVIMLVVCAISVISLSMTINKVEGLMTQHKYNRGNLDNIEAMMLEIQSIYEANYIGDEWEKGDLEDWALAGFTQGFGDEYGLYRSPTESQEKSDEKEEKLLGIGIETVYEGDKGFYIIQTYRNSPAEKAGLKEGDYIHTADGTHIEDTDSDSFLALIKGEKGTTVELGVIMDGKEQVITVERDDVKTESVRAKIVNDEVAYLEMTKFTEYSDEEFIEYMDEFLDAGIDKYILDLRSNSGGIADTAIEMLDYMLPEGLIAKMEFRDTTDNTTYTSDSKCVDADIAILVNEGSASASELVSKAMQDYGRAKIIGTTTYGKGTVCVTYNLSNGGTLTLSAGKYTTISGEEIEDIGVTPDIEVKMSEEQLKILYKVGFDEDEQFQTAYKELTGKDWKKQAE